MECRALDALRQLQRAFASHNDLDICLPSLDESRDKDGQPMEFICALAAFRVQDDTCGHAEEMILTGVLCHHGDAQYWHLASSDFCAFDILERPRNKREGNGETWLWLPFFLIETNTQSCQGQHQPYTGV